MTNDLNPLDTNVDGKVSALDALVVINALGRGDIDSSSNPLRVVAALNGYRLDASGDGDISALDALRVINGLNDQDGAGESAFAGESLSAVAWSAAADGIHGNSDDDDELLQLLAQDQDLLRGTL